jgi:hypothetical protein
LVDICIIMQGIGVKFLIFTLRVEFQVIRLLDKKKIHNNGVFRIPDKHGQNNNQFI